MKRVWVIVLLFSIIFCLSACDPASYYYDYSSLVEGVIGIELIDYNNPDCKELFDNTDGVIEFNFEKMSIIETLAEDKQSDFLHVFSEMEFLRVWKHRDSPQGKCIRLIYENGDFDVVAYNVPFVCRFNKDGSVKEFIGSAPSVQLSSIIAEYFDVNME